MHRWIRLDSVVVECMVFATLLDVEIKYRNDNTDCLVLAVSFQPRCILHITPADHLQMSLCGSIEH